MAKRSLTVAPSTTKLPQPSAARDILDDGIVMARALAASTGDENRLALARSVTHQTISAYWNAHQESALADHWPIHDLPSSVECAELSESAAALAQSMGAAAAELDVMEASYLIGVLYTATMPGRERADFGAYYTPPALCDRLIQMATEAGVDWQSARVLDPACGGGAFLSPVAQHMARGLENCSPKIALKNIVHRLKGFELDPFAAWMSHVFLEMTLLDLCRAANMRLPAVVEHLTAGALARITMVRKGAVAGGEHVLVKFPSGETRRMAPGPSSVKDGSALLSNAVYSNTNFRTDMRGSYRWT